MDFDSLLAGTAILVFVMGIIASFVSKTYVTGLVRRGSPQRMTWFVRIFIFLACSSGIYQFTLDILKRKHIAINPAWSGIGLPVSKFILELLFLALAAPFLIVSIRALIRREEPNKVNRLITVALCAVWTYLLWNVLPNVAEEVSSVFRR